MTFPALQMVRKSLNPGESWWQELERSPGFAPGHFALKDNFHGQVRLNSEGTKEFSILRIGHPTVGQGKGKCQFSLFKLDHPLLSSRLYQ
jgi:hypothetical protein